MIRAFLPEKLVAEPFLTPALYNFLQDSLAIIKELLMFHIIQNKFVNKQMCIRDRTHSSYANECHKSKLECNERLEFLGDAVLEIVSSDFLFHKFPDMPEGDLTKTRASMVCEPTLAYCAEELSLGKYLLLGKGEEATGGRNRNSVVSDAMEAPVSYTHLPTVPRASAS